MSFTVTLEGVHFTNVIKKKSFSLLILETVMVIVKVMDINKSESLSGQILLLGRKTGCLFLTINVMCSLISPKKCINFLKCLKNIMEICLFLQVLKSQRYSLTFLETTVRLIKKVTTFSIVLHCLNSTNLIVIHKHFKELQKINNWPPVLSNLIN